MRDDELMVWEARYSKEWEPTVGAKVTHITLQLLIATPHAILRYRVVTYPTGKVDLFADVQSQSKDWWSDAWNKMRHHNSMRKMVKNAQDHNGSFQQVPIRNVLHLYDKYGLEEMIGGNEMAQNAWMTAIGSSDAWSLQKVIEEAKAKTEAERLLKLQARAKELQADPQWGIF